LKFKKVRIQTTFLKKIYTLIALHITDIFLALFNQEETIPFVHEVKEDFFHNQYKSSHRKISRFIAGIFAFIQVKLFLSNNDGINQDAFYEKFSFFINFSFAAFTSLITLEIVYFFYKLFLKNSTNKKKNKQLSQNSKFTSQNQ
jgi:hypothetical protein